MPYNVSSKQVLVYRFQPQDDLTARELYAVMPWFNSEPRTKEWIPTGCERHFVEAGIRLSSILSDDTRIFED